MTLQYRRPVRSEIKEEWSEEELANKQAEAMRRIYQEERRRKYLQELQDMSNRRHADNLLLVIYLYIFFLLNNDNQNLIPNSIVFVSAPNADLLKNHQSP